MFKSSDMLWGLHGQASWRHAFEGFEPPDRLKKVARTE
jgi:hypothetical protein